MSSPLAIAAVTAILKDVLNDGLIDNDLAQVGSFLVSALPPDRIPTGETEGNRLNLFLYQVTPNQGWRNAGLPSQNAAGARLANPPLALNLHYMLTAYGSSDLNAEILLGYAMEIMADMPMLPRAAIRRSLSPNSPINVALVPPDADGRSAIDLADQLELVKITPNYPSADELSRLWTAMQARFRPTAVYQVSTVLIQHTRPVRAAPPVLQRGADDQGINSQPNLALPSSSLSLLSGVTIDSPDGRHLSAELGDTLILQGSQLAGDTVTAEFHHPLLAVPNELPLAASANEQRAPVVLPAAGTGATDSEWPAGQYTVALRIERAGKPVRRTNEMGFTLAPRLTAAPVLSAGPAPFELTLQLAPQVWPGQRLDIFVGGEPFRPAQPAVKTGQLSVTLAGLALSETPLPVVLRVQGVDSIIVRDIAAQPPRFDPQQTITVPG
jgi:hypothetical protein